MKYFLLLNFGGFSLKKGLEGWVIGACYGCYCGLEGGGMKGMGVSYRWCFKWFSTISFFSGMFCLGYCSGGYMLFSLSFKFLGVVYGDRRL